VNPLDRRVRYRVYRGFVDHGVAPRIADIAASEGIAGHEVRASLQRLADAHLVVLGPGDPGVLMAHPFAGRTTGHVTQIGERRWNANCAWDALAILALLGAGTAETIDPTTQGTHRFIVTGDDVEPSGVVHFPVPARQFWDDIGYT
jgi:hypothetical protein